MKKYRTFFIRRKARLMFYKVFGRLLFKREARRRKKINKKIYIQHKLETSFRYFENKLRVIQYPDNNFNKMMSMILNDIELFIYISARFKRDRQILKQITLQDEKFRFLGSKEKSYPSHPYQKSNSRAIKIDVQSLFIFGMILVNRSLLLLKMYLSDRAADPKRDMYGKVGAFYFELVNSSNLSPLAQKFKNLFLPQIKWLYAVLRFYRNEFIEHLDRGYQQGTNYGFYMDDFALSTVKWNYGTDDDVRIEGFRQRLEGRGIQISGRSDGGRSLINRYYIQQLFDNVLQVPDDMLKEALEIIEDAGVRSPQPTNVIDEIELYVEGLFKFMFDELDQSELAQYKK